MNTGPSLSDSCFSLGHPNEWTSTKKLAALRAEWDQFGEAIGNLE
jgi:hypothetical protein